MQSTSHLLSAFVTMLVTMGPIETAAVFVGVTSGIHRPHRKSLAMRATSIAGAVFALFAVGGVFALELLHVSLAAFRVAGGLLLFIQALTLVFSARGLSSISESEQHEAKAPGDIAVFPLAFPVIAGPGSLSAIVLLTAQTSGLTEKVLLLAILSVCLLITLVAMLAADSLAQRLGQTGADVVSRISGLLLAALAVQFVFDGLAQAPFMRHLN